MPIAEGTVPWPDEFVQRYVAARYWQGRLLGALLTRPPPSGRTRRRWSTANCG